jgi:hypothetical protein
MKRIFISAACAIILALGGLAGGILTGMAPAWAAPATFVIILDALTGKAYSSTNPLPVGSGTVTVTQTVVTLTAATSRTLIAANASRKYLFWMNIGTAPMTVAPGAVTVTAGQGANFDPGSSSSNQGGTFSMENSSVSQQAFSAISTAGTTVVVWEGQ